MTENDQIEARAEAETIRYSWNQRTIEKRIIDGGLFKCEEDEVGLGKPIGLYKFSNDSNSSLHTKAAIESAATLELVRDLARIIVKSRRQVTGYSKKVFLEGLSRKEWIDDKTSQFEQDLKQFMEDYGYPVEAAAKDIKRICNKPVFKKALRKALNKALNESDAFVTPSRAETEDRFYFYNMLYLAFEKFYERNLKAKKPTRRKIVYYMAHLLCRFEKGALANPTDVEGEFNKISRFISRQTSMEDPRSCINNQFPVRFETDDSGL